MSLPLDLTPRARLLRQRFPVGARVRLRDGRCGTVTWLARDRYEQTRGGYRHRGVEIAVRPDGASGALWYDAKCVAEFDDGTAHIGIDGRWQ